MTIGEFIDYYKKTGVDLTRVDTIDTTTADGINLLLAVVKSFDGGFETRQTKTLGVNVQDDSQDKFCLRDLVVMAGACGLTSYRDLEPWEVFAFGEGGNRAAWGRLSSLMALINNCHVTKRKDAKQAIDFNPTITHTEKVKQRQAGARDISSIKEILKHGS